MTRMLTLREKRVKPTVFVIAVAASTLLACSLVQRVLSTSMGDDAAEEPASEEATRSAGGLTSTTAPNAMGIALDPNGDSIPLATFGSLGLGDMNGVVAADIPEGPSGWVMSEAQGYAPGFADLGEGGTEPVFFEARLTPWSDLAELEAGESDELVAQAGEELSLIASVDGSSFASQPVMVSLTWIDGLDVGPAFEPLSSGEAVELRWAFSFLAADETGETVDLAEGASVVVRIQGTAAETAQPILALFDPESGTWIVQPDACIEAAEGGIECMLESLATLAGLFSPRVTAFGPSTVGAERVALASPVALLPHPGGDVQDDAMKEAYARLQSWWQRKDAGEPVSDQELQSLLDDLAKAAEDYASGHRNEAGKFHLMFAAQNVGLSGNAALEDQLKAEAAKLAEEIARQLLESGDCGRWREMDRAAAQVDLLGGDPALEAALLEKIQKLLSTCDLWTGTITYFFDVEKTHPGDLEGYSRTAGSGTWTEEHKVRMATNAKTFVLTGEDYVRLAFPMVTYSDSGDCPSQFFYFGDPAEHGLWLYFGGTYDGRVFSVGDPTPAEDAKSISVSQRWLIKDHEGSKGCVVKSDTPFAFPNYRSALIGIFDAIPITLQEMLDRPSFGGSGSSLESIQGSEKILNPMPEAGIFPFKEGRVYWFFTHEPRLLPLE